MINNDETEFRMPGIGWSALSRIRPLHININIIVGTGLYSITYYLERSYLI